MARTKRRRRALSVEFVAGWLFADLLLVLFLVGLGSSQPQAAPPPEPEPTPVLATPKPQPKPPEIIGMRTDPRSVSISFDAGALLSTGARAGAEQEVCRAVRREVASFKGDRAALVLIFGGASDVTIGQEVARRIGSQLTCASPGVFARKTPTRPFWDGTLPQGQARLEIFTFTTQKAG